MRHNRLPLRGRHKGHIMHKRHKEPVVFFVPFVLFVALLHGHGFGQVARLVDVTAAPHGDVIRKQLQRDNRENR